MKIKLKLEVSQDRNTQIIELGDLNLSPKEWEGLTESERENILAEYVDNLHESPYWVLSSFEEIK